MKILIQFLFGFLIFTAFAACREVVVKEEARNVNAINTETTVIDNVNIFLENSKSMAGYIYFSTDFSREMDQILVKLNKRYGDKVFSYTAGVDFKSYGNDLSEFRKDLNPTNSDRIAIENSSLLNNILKQVIDSTKNDQVSILITDGIMSGSNEDLSAYDNPRQQKYFNIDNLASSLKGDITLALASKQKKVMKVMAFHSDFHTGKVVNKKRYFYYKADNNVINGPVKVKNNILPNRPYYLILVGGELEIRAFEKKTKGVFNPLKTIEFGFNYDDIRFKLTNECNLRKHTRAKSVMQNSGDVHELEFKENEQSYRFCALLDLENLDKMFREKEYLGKYLKVKINSTSYNASRVINLLNEDIEELWYSGKGEYKGYTHLVIFELNDYRPNSGDDIFIRMRNDVEYWSSTTNWSSESDLNMEYDDASTFGLKYLIQGIKTAYYDDSEQFIFNENISKILIYK